MTTPNPGSFTGAILKSSAIRNLSQNQIRSAVSSQSVRIISHPARRFAISSESWAMHSDIFNNIFFHMNAPHLAAPYQVVQSVLSRTSIPLTNEQKQAIISLSQHPIHILNGGPGTGKSTILSILCAILQKTSPNKRIVVAAFSARIADATAQKCNVEGITLHSLLGLRPGENNEKAKTRKTCIDPSIQTIIVDEAYSASTELIHTLLRLLKPGQRLILAGDPNQILPIGDGRSLHDITDMDILPVCTLTHGHRLASSPHLQEQIKRIEKGKMPHEGPGLKIITENSPIPDDRRRRKIQKAISIHIEKIKSGLNHAILTQRRTGQSGYRQINRAITKRDQPGVGDNIITTAKWPENPREWKDSENRWSNGSYGRIIGKEGGIITLLFENGQEIQAPETVQCLEFTHAISAHRAQGLEYDSTTVILDAAAKEMLNRQYLVAALSRSPKVTLITEPGMINRAVDINGLDQRPSTLKAVARSRENHPV